LIENLQDIEDKSKPVEDYRFDRFGNGKWVAITMTAEGPERVTFGIEEI